MPRRCCTFASICSGTGSTVVAAQLLVYNSVNVDINDIQLSVSLESVKRTFGYQQSDTTLNSDAYPALNNQHVHW